MSSVRVWYCPLIKLRLEIDSEVSLTFFNAIAHQTYFLSRRLHNFVAKLCETLRFPLRSSAFKLLVIIPINPIISEGWETQPLQRFGTIYFFVFPSNTTTCILAKATPGSKEYKNADNKY